MGSNYGLTSDGCRTNADETRRIRLISYHVGGVGQAARRLLYALRYYGILARVNRGISSRTLQKTAAGIYCKRLGASWTKNAFTSSHAIGSSIFGIGSFS